MPGFKVNGRPRAELSGESGLLFIRYHDGEDKKLGGAIGDPETKIIAGIACLSVIPEEQLEIGHSDLDDSLVVGGIELSVRTDARHLLEGKVTGKHLAEEIQ